MNANCKKDFLPVNAYCLIFFNDFVLFLYHTGLTVTPQLLMNFVDITKCHIFCLRLQNQAKLIGCSWAAQDMVLIYM